MTIINYNGSTGTVLNNGINPATKRIFNTLEINKIKSKNNPKLDIIYKYYKLNNYDMNSPEYLQYLKLYKEINEPTENLNNSIYINNTDDKNYKNLERIEKTINDILININNNEQIIPEQIIPQQIIPEYREQNSTFGQMKRSVGKKFGNIGKTWGYTTKPPKKGGNKTKKNKKTKKRKPRKLKNLRKTKK